MARGLVQRAGEFRLLLQTVPDDVVGRLAFEDALTASIIGDVRGLEQALQVARLDTVMANTSRPMRPLKRSTIPLV